MRTGTIAFMGWLLASRLRVKPDFAEFPHAAKRPWDASRTGREAQKQCLELVLPLPIVAASSAFGDRINCERELPVSGRSRRAVPVLSPVSLVQFGRKEQDEHRHP